MFKIKIENEIFQGFSFFCRDRIVYLFGGYRRFIREEGGVENRGRTEVLELVVIVVSFISFVTTLISSYTLASSFLFFSLLSQFSLFFSLCSLCCPFNSLRTTCVITFIISLFIYLFLIFLHNLTTFNAAHS